MSVLKGTGDLPRCSGGSRSAKIGLLVLLLLYAFFGQGVRGLWKPDEGRYTCVALNMIDQGDWLVPRLNDDKQHFTKPPLAYWAVGASLWGLGRNEWAARFPNSLALVGTILLIAAMGPRLSPRHPHLAAVIYASSPLVYIAANLVTTDTLLAFWETLAMYGFLEWWHRRETKNHGRWKMLMWAAFGLAFMTKGPPGLLPLLPLLVFAGMRGGRQVVGDLFSWAGLVLFATIGLTWYAVVGISNPSLLGYFVGDEIYGRIVTGQHHRNSQWYGAFVVYIPTLFLGMLPWSLTLFGKLRRSGVKRWSSINPFQQRLSAHTQLLLLWFLIPLAFFFLARSRLPLYMLPLFVPFSLILARQFDGLDPWQGRRRWWIIGWVVVMASTRIIGGRIDSEKDSRAFALSIQRQVKSQAREIVFVDDEPDWGLKFYLNAEVERVNFKPDYGEETLDQEFTKPEPGQVFIIKRRDESKFLRNKPPTGNQWKRTGTTGDSIFYVMDAPTPLSATK